MTKGKCNCANCKLRRELVNFGLRQRLNKFYQHNTEYEKRQREIQNTEKPLKLTDRNRSLNEK
jgi:hypothetical protein